MLRERGAPGLAAHRGRLRRIGDDLLERGNHGIDVMFPDQKAGDAILDEVAVPLDVVGNRD